MECAAVVGPEGAIIQQACESRSAAGPERERSAGRVKGITFCSHKSHRKGLLPTQTFQKGDFNHSSEFVAFMR